MGSEFFMIISLYSVRLKNLEGTKLLTEEIYIKFKKTELAEISFTVGEMNLKYLQLLTDSLLNIYYYA